MIVLSQLALKTHANFGCAASFAMLDHVPVFFFFFLDFKLLPLIINAFVSQGNVNLIILKFKIIFLIPLDFKLTFFSLIIISISKYFTSLMVVSINVKRERISNWYLQRGSFADFHKILLIFLEKWLDICFGRHVIFQKIIFTYFVPSFPSVTINWKRSFVIDIKSRRS
jgi:hypothetical protein